MIGSATPWNNSALVDATPVLDANVAASSSASTVLTNASIMNSAPCTTSLSAVKSDTYDCCY